MNPKYNTSLLRSITGIQRSNSMYKQHTHKILNATSVIDNKPPKHYTFIQKNKKGKSIIVCITIHKTS